MPIAEPSQTPLRQAALVGLGAAATIAVVLFLVSRTASLGGSQNAVDESGNPILSIGDAAEMAALVAADGPFTLPGPAGNQWIWINHLGDDPNDGWVAFVAQREGSEPNCAVQWDPEADHFIDSCDATIYSADGVDPSGVGLERKVISVSADGELMVNTLATVE